MSGHLPLTGPRCGPASDGRGNASAVASASAVCRRAEPATAPPPACSLAALLGALLGASAIMVSPITPWTTALVVIGILLLLPSATVLGACGCSGACDDTRDLTTQ